MSDAIAMVDAAVVMGVPLDALTLDTTIERIDGAIRRGRAEGTTCQIATVNVDFMVNALDDAELLAILQRSDINLADGMPLVWAAAAAGMPLPDRVAGSDLVPRLALESARRGWRIHLWGGAPGVADRACQRLLADHPGASISAEEAPHLDDVREIDDRVLDRIVEHRPDVLCVALGNPKQERFIEAHRDRLGCPVLIGVGGSLDMIVGDRRRAPGWAQSSGLEWVFRAAQEPGRLGRRYAHDARTLGPQLARYVRAARRYRTGASLDPVRSGTHLEIGLTTAAHDTVSLPSFTSIRSVHLDLRDDLTMSVAAQRALVRVLREADRGAIELSSASLGGRLGDCLRDFKIITWIERLVE